MAIQDELPRSRLTLTYKTTINGAPETVNLPFRLLVMGDFSGGSSPDRALDLEQRRLRSIDGRNLDSVMKDMKMSVSFKVKNRIDPETAQEIDVELPIERMKSFNPDLIAESVPKIKALLLLKQLLQEIQSNIDNRRELRKVIQELFSTPGAIEKLLGQLKDYEGVRLPAKSSVPAESKA